MRESTESEMDKLPIESEQVIGLDEGGVDESIVI
jgi:hypothetical protein